jgi:hypothetical protein
MPVRTYLDAAKWLALGSAMLLSMLAAILPLAGFGGLLSYAVAGFAVVVGFSAIGLVIAARRPMLETAVLAVFLAVAGLLFTINVTVTASKSNAAAAAMAKAAAKENEVRQHAEKLATEQKAVADVTPKGEESAANAKAEAALKKAEEAEGRATKAEAALKNLEEAAAKAADSQKATHLLEQIKAEQVKLDIKREQIAAEAAGLAAEQAKIDKQNRDLKAEKKAAADLAKAAKAIVPAPDKRIAELEAENNLLKTELEKLRTKLAAEPAQLPITKADFRQKVMTFKNLGPGYGPGT